MESELHDAGPEGKQKVCYRIQKLSAGTAGTFEIRKNA